MDSEIIVGVLALAGVLVSVFAGQHFQHKRWAAEQARWAAEQDSKHAELMATAAAERKSEAERAARERREEQAQFLDRMAEQTNTVVANAVRLAEVHQADAEKARLLAIETATAHTECRQEVAHLGGKVEELRARVAETERTSGRETLISQRHQDLKHKTMTALAVSEGVTSLAVSLARKCTCHAFEAMADLSENYRPRLDDITAENRMSLEEWLESHKEK